MSQHYNSANVDIRIVEGDLFDQPGNLVVGFSDTFDTAIPNIIATASVQGQFLERIYGGDIQQLDAALDAALASLQSSEHVAKPGKTNRYAMGTVAALQQGRRFFFCIAYTRMNDQNVAVSSIDGVWRSLLNLWESVSTYANGDTVAMPVLGGGLARLSQILPAQDSIRLIILSFMFACRNSRVCQGLDIVVRKQDVKNLDMPELQAFLKSLRAS